MDPDRPPKSAGLLGDTAVRDYSRKLRLFNAFAEPELRQAIASLDLKPGMRVLDAGCGTGEALQWLTEAIAPEGTPIGMDLAAAHANAARAITKAETAVLQADLLQPPLPHASFDLVWCVNTINHIREPLRAIESLSALLRPGGRIALGQSSLLPDMFFAWDSRLEQLTNDAVRHYYRGRYQVDERDLTAVRAIKGLLHSAGLKNIAVRTFVIERIPPLRAADERYLLEAVFRDTWSERLRFYLSGEDYEELARLCNPDHADFALRRPDFHFLQTFTLAVGSV